MLKRIEDFENIFDNLHEAVCIVNENGKVMLWSKSSEELYNVKKSDILGKSLVDFFPDALLLTVLNTKTPIENAFHVPRENTYINISAIPLFKDGKLIGAVGTDRDISEVAALSEELSYTKEKLDYFEGKDREKKLSFTNIIGNSDEIKKTIAMAEKVAKSNVSILITGESGTGKEVFARAIHAKSASKGSFIPINCSAIPESLFESEMFGYEAGSFTGALNKGKMGKIEIADKGTLFLDEIGDMPLYMQAKLLRVIQEKQIMRVGADKPIDVDVRIISATHRNLLEMVKENKFREDLYYRLNVVNLQVPKLNKRKSDIPALVEYFINQFCIENKMSIPKIEEEVMLRLMSYDWPGNIRELKNKVQNLIVFANNGVIHAESLPERIFSSSTEGESQSYDLQARVAQMESDLIRNALKISQGNKMKASKLLNIPRSTLYYKIKELNIEED